MPIRLIERAARHRDRVAVHDDTGEHTYDELLAASARGAAALLGGRGELAEARVAFLAPAGFTHPAIQWGIWRAGGIAVPLCTFHPRPELEYVIEDCGVEILVATPAMADRLRSIAGGRGLRFLESERLLSGGEAPLPEVDADRRALIVYTSGTTSRPKGVVTTHANLAAQTRSLVEAWAWSADDRILLVLPLHHVHGIVNVLACALWSGATVETIAAFDAGEVWERLASGRLTLFMAVPTIYRRLLAAWEAAPPDRRRRWSEGARGLRLMVSGSAALPVSTLERWREATGHTLLERYGMTETGMILSNPLAGERRPGHVGVPLPGVEVRRRLEDGEAAPPDAPAEIEVRGPGVFAEYWRRPDATAEAFDGGWFRTGDVAVIEDGAYRLLGRSSVDIIKSGGYKVSALEIEEVLRTHPAIAECAVVGVPDADWGECVAAAVEPAGDDEIALEDLRSWAKERLAAYKAPARLLVVEALPRNALGKVIKAEVVRLFD